MAIAAGIGLAAFGIVALMQKFGGWDSIFTDQLTQLCIWIQGVVRIFCGQFFHAFDSFDASITTFLKMFGVEGNDLADLNWAQFKPDGTVLNAFAAFALIGVFVAVLILVISLFKIALAPIVEAREKPLTVVVRFAFAMILIFYSPSIISMFSSASSILGAQIESLATSYAGSTDDNDLFKKVTHYEEIDDEVGDSLKEGGESEETPEGAPDLDAIQAIAVAIIEVVCNIVLMIEFLKLLTEICMREMVLLMLYMLFPSMAGTYVSRDTETIFKRYLQALIVQILLVSTSIIWYWMFMDLCSNMDFKTWGIVVGMLFEIGFIQMAKNVDNHLAQLGVSSAAVSSNLFDSIMGTVRTAAATMGVMSHAAHTVSNGASAISSGVSALRHNSVGTATADKKDPSVLANAVRGGEKVAFSAQELQNAQPGSKAGATVRQAMANPTIFNTGMDHGQRDACVTNMFGADSLAKMAVESGISKMPSSWTMNKDGSITGHDAQFASGNIGDITLSSANKVAPGAAMQQKYDMENGRPNEKFTMGAQGTIRASDVALKNAPATDGEAISQTGHTLDELKAKPGMAAGFMDSAENYMQGNVLGSKDDKSSIRSNMAESGIQIKDGSMSTGRDGLVHGKAQIGGAGEQNVVMGSEQELRNAGFSNVATFKDASGNDLAMALAKEAGRGSVESTENLSDAQAQILTGTNAQQFKDNAVNHADLYANNAERNADVMDSMGGSEITGEAFKNSGMELDVNAKGEIHGQVPDGASYNFERHGQADLSTPEGVQQAEEFARSDTGYNFVDSAGNMYTAAAELDGEAHGHAGSYDFPESDASQGSNMEKDAFAYNVGSSVEDIRTGFNVEKASNISGITIEDNGAQTAYNQDGEIEGVRMANRQTSTRGNQDYKYDSVHSSGITDSTEAAEVFGEPAQSTDGGKTWETQSGTRYERMSSANKLFYSEGNSRTRMVDGKDSVGNPYTYVMVEKPKGFTSSSRPETDGRKDGRRRKRVKH